MFASILLATATLLPNFALGAQLTIPLREQRIYNGYSAEIADTKHQVSIRSRSMDWLYFGMGHICGGSLISPNVVLTAAHCLASKKGRPLKKSQFIVVMGNLSRLTRDDNTLVYNMKNITIHRDFNHLEVVFDIAYIVLDGHVPKNHPTAQPIALIDSKVVDGTICQVTGWGYTEKGSPSDHLMQVDVAKIDTNICKQGYEGYLKGVGQLCAGYMEGIKDSCYGDSGGPLVCNGKLAGIVSFGAGCALRNKPGIYTDVWFFNDWIERLNLEAQLTSLTEEFGAVKSTIVGNKRCQNFCRRFLDGTKELFIFLS